VLSPSPATSLPSFWRRFAGVWLAGLLGVLTLLLQPIPAAVRSVPELAGMPEAALRLVVLANPAFLVTLLAVAGAGTAHRSGLRSALAGTARARDVRFSLALVTGLCLAVVMVAIDRAWAPVLGEAWQQVLDTADASAGWASLVLGIGYGGLAEEAMMRWGVMSAVAWALAAAARGAGLKAGAGWVLAIAALVAAAVFAAGHLPALGQQVALTPGIVARTLALNLLAGLVYGWLYARGTLESAMVAHAGTHAGFAIVRALT
jgi:hypothetical protein